MKRQIKRPLPLFALYLLGIFVGMSAAPAWAFGWQDLWRTPEQQAQQMLDAGHAKEAAQAFRDPRRRAYAQSRASQFAEAAKTLAPLADTDAQYNRGNALAHAGKLQEALAAYDDVLKRNPQDKDARRNRDLVAQALQQQQQQASQSGKNGNPSQQGKSSQNAQQGQSGTSPSSQSSQSSPGQQPPTPSPQNKAGAQNQAASGAPRTQSSPASNDSRQAPDKAPSQQSRPGTSQSTPSAKDDAAQARRDADAALNAAQSQPQAQPATAQALARRDTAHGDQSAPAQDVVIPRESERALAQEQWLRRIPDDPGGLLRRKFMIEHMLRQQENRQ